MGTPPFFPKCFLPPRNHFPKSFWLTEKNVSPTFFLLGGNFGALSSWGNNSLWGEQCTSATAKTHNWDFQHFLIDNFFLSFSLRHVNWFYSKLLLNIKKVTIYDTTALWDSTISLQIPMILENLNNHSALQCLKLPINLLSIISVFAYNGCCVSPSQLVLSECLLIVFIIQDHFAEHQKILWRSPSSVCSLERGG